VFGKKEDHMVAVLLACLLLIWLLSSCEGWEEVGEGVAKGQGTAEVEISKQATAVAQGAATAVESYEQEREREGKSTCASAMVPVVVVGLALGWERSRRQRGCAEKAGRQLGRR
jgi:hypothetical protein